MCHMQLLAAWGNMASIRQALAAVRGTTPAMVNGIVGLLNAGGLDCEAPGGAAGAFHYLTAAGLEGSGLTCFQVAAVLAAQQGAGALGPMPCSRSTGLFVTAHISVSQECRLHSTGPHPTALFVLHPACCCP